MIPEQLVRRVAEPWKKPCYIFNEKLPCLNWKLVCEEEEEGKKWAALEGLPPPHSLNRAVKPTTTFPSYAF